MGNELAQIYGQWTSSDIWAMNHRTWCFPAWKYRGTHHFTTINKVHPPGVEALRELDQGGGPESVPQPWDKSWAPRSQWQQVEDDARGDVPTSVRASGLSFSSLLSSFYYDLFSFLSLSILLCLQVNPLLHSTANISCLSGIVWRKEGGEGRPKKCNHGSQAGGINTILRNTNTISILILGEHTVRSLHTKLNFINQSTNTFCKHNLLTISWGTWEIEDIIETPNEMTWWQEGEKWVLYQLMSSKMCTF